MQHFTASLFLIEQIIMVRGFELFIDCEQSTIIRESLAVKQNPELDKKVKWKLLHMNIRQKLRSSYNSFDHWECIN